MVDVITLSNADLGELRSSPFGMATASLAGVPRDRVLNYLGVDEVVAWARELEEAT
jgi:hypothetical protein